MSKFYLWDIYYLILLLLVYKKYEIWKNGKKWLSKKKSDVKFFCFLYVFVLILFKLIYFLLLNNLICMND